MFLQADAIFFSTKALCLHKISKTPYEVNKWTQEPIQSDPHEAPNTKGKDRQMQLSSKNEQMSSRAGNFPKKLGILLPKLNWIYLKLTYVIKGKH